MSLTGDPVKDRMVGPAWDMVLALRRGDGPAMVHAMDEAAALVDNDRMRALAGLTYVLAAMVPDDQAPAELLRWVTGDRSTYQRLRADGASSRAAAIRARAAAADPGSADRVVPIREGR